LALREFCALPSHLSSAKQGHLLKAIVPSRYPPLNRRGLIFAASFNKFTGAGGLCDESKIRSA
jgi:hypothetical protein